MPELPEVEILVRHLRPLLRNRVVRSVTVYRPKIIHPSTTAQLRRALVQCSFTNVRRRGKYLVFSLRAPRRAGTLNFLGHLGMTGRIYLQKPETPVPRHTVVALDLGSARMIFQDTRAFGRLSLDLRPLEHLGPEPHSADFHAAGFAASLKGSDQRIKIKLMDQAVVAGIGNIYASEALFLARIHPDLKAGELMPTQIRALCSAIRRVLDLAIRRGSTVPLDWKGTGTRDRLFYYGSSGHSPRNYVEKLRVYNRAGQPCSRCKTLIHRITQAGRSTYFCPLCQGATSRSQILNA